jgi:hypothetical protein
VTISTEFSRTLNYQSSRRDARRPKWTIADDFATVLAGRVFANGDKKLKCGQWH